MLISFDERFERGRVAIQMSLEQLAVCGLVRFVVRICQAEFSDGGICPAAQAAGV